MDADSAVSSLTPPNRGRKLLLNMTIIFTRARKAALGALAFLAVLFAALPARADAGDPPEIEAQRLVHILGYVTADYGGAVQKGAIASEAEYAEQLSLLGDAEKIAAKIQPNVPAGSKATALVASIKKVRSLVEAKASEAEVQAAIAPVKNAVVSAFRLSEAPASSPDPLRGKALYAEHCATCHGETGKADTKRAATLNPRPVDFHDPKVAEGLSPARAASTIRFGINGTSMVPFTFLSETDRWAIAFYVLGLRHRAEPAKDAPTYTLAELAMRTDGQLADDLTAAGVADGRKAQVLSDLRRRAPYESRAGKNPLALARTKLDRARFAVRKGDRDGARGQLVDAYLEGIEPAEAALRSVDGALVSKLEEHFLAVRGKLQANADPEEIEASIEALLRDVTRAELLMTAPTAAPSFLSTALSSGGILLREGVEAALLIGALLGLAAQAGLSDRKRYVHLGWLSAVVLGIVTWIAASRLVTLSGASRELIEGVTAVLAAAVLFYVSYSLLAKKEVARWMKFLKASVSPRNAALSLFGVSFLAAYREAFETVLFYQALLSTNPNRGAAVAGAAVGALVLLGVVTLYTRAGRFAPPQLFFRVSSYLLYALAIAFAGKGVAALQLAGLLPIHSVPVPTVSALGIHPTVETCAVQLLLLALAVFAFFMNRQKTSLAANPSVQKAA
jgi:high-affinity iron transporter